MKLPTTLKTKTNEGSDEGEANFSTTLIGKDDDLWINFMLRTSKNVAPPGYIRYIVYKSYKQTHFLNVSSLQHTFEEVWFKIQA